MIPAEVLLRDDLAAILDIAHSNTCRFTRHLDGNLESRTYVLHRGIWYSVSSVYTSDWELVKHVVTEVEEP